MASEDIESPPYPSEAANPDVLYNHLKSLKGWVEKYRGSHNKSVGKALIPNVKDLPDRKAYTGQPVSVMMGHFLFLRRLRESWDHLLRTYEYENDWDTKACLRQRVMMLQSASVLLNNAFTPQEHREAMAKRDTERMQGMFEKLTETLHEYMEPTQHDPEAERPKGFK